jgi:hypothetical protein
MCSSLIWVEYCHNPIIVEIQQLEYNSHLWSYLTLSTGFLRLDFIPEQGPSGKFNANQ